MLKLTCEFNRLRINVLKQQKKLQRLTAKIYFLNVSAYTVAQSHTATSTTSEVLT